MYVGGNGLFKNFFSKSSFLIPGLFLSKAFGS
jgi:hypothetical protein